MKTELKNYIHISQMKDGKEEHSAANDKAVKKLEEEKKDFQTFSRIDYTETQFETVQEILDAKMPDGTPVTDDVKIDIWNRGWVLAQQAAAKDIVLSDDEDFVNKDGLPVKESPVDISGEAFAPKTRKGTSEARTKKGIKEMWAKDPDKLMALIEELRREQAAAGVTV